MGLHFKSEEEYFKWLASRQGASRKEESPTEVQESSFQEGKIIPLVKKVQESHEELSRAMYDIYLESERREEQDRVMLTIEYCILLSILFVILFLASR